MWMAAPCSTPSMGEKLSDSIMRVAGVSVFLISDDAQLQRAAEKWRAATCLAVDSEFVRERTYYPIAGLYQVFDGEACYLVDPVAIDDLSPFAAVLEDPQIEIVMHSCSEDLELFDHDLKVLPTRLFDTQIATVFLGLGLSMGFQAAVEAFAGTRLDKSQTRTNWVKRPLASEQLRYAAEDVIYLLPLYHACLQALDKAGKRDWCLSECASLISRRDPEVRAAQFRQISGAGRLSPRELALLARLYRWREAAAMQADLPRTWIATDKVLLAIANHLPQEIVALADISGLSPALLKRHGEVLLGLVEEVSGLAESDLPNKLPGPLTAGQSKRVKRLKLLVQKHGEQLNLTPELLAKKRDFVDLVRRVSSGEEGLPESLRGWRSDVLGQALLEELQ